MKTIKFLSAVISSFIFIILFNCITYSIWVQQASPVTTDLNSACAVNSSICWMCGPGNVVIRTTNGGTQWTMANNGLTGNDFYSIFALDAATCWIGSGTGTLWRTTNGGLNWINVPLSPSAPFINVIHFFDINSGFVLGDPANGIWRYYITTNGSNTWTLGANAPAATGSEAGWNNSYCALDTGHIWWGTNNSKIYKGSFRGPFVAASTELEYSISVAFNNTINGAASTSNNTFTEGDIVLSSNGGVNWNNAYTNYGAQYGMKGIPGTTYMWMTGWNGFLGYVSRSTNNGVSWSAQLTLPANNAGGCISMANINCGWVGTMSVNSGSAGKIFKYIDYVGIVNNEIPSSFKLEQNYPNPFNPTTKINYELRMTNFVQLIIFDILGRKIATLVSKKQDIGKYEVEWNASDFPSGVYYYKLSAGDYNEVRKMVLIK